jgi:hypothetical protein
MLIATNSTYLLIERYVNKSLSEDAIELLWEKIFEKPFLFNVLLVMVLCKKWSTHNKKKYRPYFSIGARAYMKASKFGHYYLPETLGTGSAE